MRAKAFLETLEQALPVWIENGWVDAGHGKAILDHAAASARPKDHLAMTIATLGVVTVAAGVITFFAANWGVLAKALKLAVLFGAMTAIYGGAIVLLARETYPAIGRALLLLGVLLFGANIMLIAQIYHIDSHYPDGIMVWALGALLISAVYPNLATVAAGLALAVLWSNLEFWEFDVAVHWPFLVVWSCFVAIIVRQDWRSGGHLAFLALSFWLVMVLVMTNHDHKGYLPGIYAILSLGVFAVAGHPRLPKKLADLAGTLKRYAAVIGLASFYLLTLRWFHETLEAEAPAGLYVATFLALALAFGAVVLRRIPSGSVSDPSSLSDGTALVLAISIAVAQWASLSGSFGPEMIVLVFKLLFFAALIWLAHYGYRRQMRFLVTLAAMFFATGLVTLYFSDYWTLASRSIFFLAGGAVMLGDGYWLERQRRRLTGHAAPGARS